MCTYVDNTQYLITFNKKRLNEYAWNDNGIDSNSEQNAAFNEDMCRSHINILFEHYVYII